MASEWYYAKEGAQQGPVSDEQVKQLISAGHIQPTDLIWKNGMADWQPLAQIPEFATTAAPAPPPMPAAPQAPTSGAAPAPAGSRPSSTDDIWPILVLAGGAILFLSFFMPWWGMTQTEAKDKSSIKKVKRAIDTFKDNEDWYDDHGVTEALEDEEDENEDADEVSVWLWGWGSGVGITTFVFSFAVLPLAIVPMFVAPAQKWAWIGSFLCAIFGLVTLILFLVWFFGSPSENVSPILAQGVMLGAYMSFIAAALLLAGGIMDGINGVKSIVKARKA